jgi:hypothetical protein
MKNFKDEIKNMQKQENHNSQSGSGSKQSSDPTMELATKLFFQENKARNLNTSIKEAMRLYITIILIFSVFIFGTSGAYITITKILRSFLELAPAPIIAAMVTGIFGIVALLIGNYLNRQKDRQLKEKERKEDFYEELINKIHYFLVNTEALKNGSDFDQSMQGFIGKLYIFGDDEVIKNFYLLLDVVKNEGDLIKSRQLTYLFICTLRRNIGYPNKGISESNLLTFGNQS